MIPTRRWLRLAAATLLLCACGKDGEPGTTPPAAAPDASSAGDVATVGDAAGDEGPAPDLGADVGAPDEDAVPGDTGPAVEDTPAPPPECEDKPNGWTCDDGDACTTDDECSFGECGGAPYTCSDGLGCTRDECDGLGGCSFPIKGDRCLIAGVCWSDGDASPDGCLSCVVPVSQNTWTADDTLTCEDGDFCTTGEYCFGGVCVGDQTNATDCDDGNWCTDDGCSQAFGCTHAPNERPCSDADPCTVGDTCTNGKCLAGATFVTCDDKNSCTLDICLPDAGGCLHEPQTYACDDGNPCTIGDQCQDGACAGGDPLSCIDDNPCTDDLCHPAKGCVFVNNSADCSDGDPCTTGDKCAFGACNQGPLQTLCNDFNVCTTDLCSPQTGECEHTPDNFAQCSDDNPCTIGDFCEAGACKSGGQTVLCDDENDCTDDHCGADGTCVFTPNLLECDDGDPCTKGDECTDGLCVAGTKPLICGDQNPCTDSFCEAGVGCQFVYNNAPCNDGNACTVGDVCVSGQCTTGPQGAGCDDGNACTDDQCLSTKGCVNAPNNAICNDDDPCTISDQCTMGVCTGEVSECDDGNECTKEICLAGGGCKHIPINSFECKPRIQFINPPRGAMLKGPGPVIVTGAVKTGSAGLKDFFINGLPIEVNPISGAFVHVMEPTVGINLIQAVANSMLGGEDTAIRSFAYTTEYFAPGSMVPGGLGLWLSQLVWDDNNTSDVDDIATVITIILESFDLPGLIPNPLTSTKALQCTFTVYVKSAAIGQPQVDLKTKNQALGLTVRYPNLSIALDADASGFFCPSISGSVSADWVTVSMDLVIQEQGGGQVGVTMANPSVSIQGLDVDIDGILGFLVNWIIDFFEGTIADQIEGMVIGQLDILPEMMANALEGLAIETEFELPSLLGDGPPSTLTLSSSLTGADFDQFGGFLELGTVVTAAGGGGVPYDTLGSLGRAKCMQDEDFFDYLMQAELEIAIKDDMMNQLLHAAWHSGAFEFPLPQSLLGDVDVSEFGVVINDLSVSFMLPPVMSSCNFEDQPILGIGDVKVHASLSLFDQPLELTAFASAQIAAELVVKDNFDGSSIGIVLEDVLVFDVEVEDVSAGFEGAQGAVEELILQFLGPDIFTNLGNGALADFPLPSIPLDGFDESIPSGTVLELDLTKVYRLGGRTVAAGNAK